MTGVPSPTPKATPHVNGYQKYVPKVNGVAPPTPKPNGIASTPKATPAKIVEEVSADPIAPSPEPTEAGQKRKKSLA